jgi:regulator of cell morphogenesis and NO signaling
LGAVEKVSPADYAEMKIGKIVAKDYRKAMVFKSHGIDFCCGGAATLKSVVEEKALTLDEILSELEAIDYSEEVVEDYENWDCTRLVDHIVNTHHAYVRKTVEQLTPMLTKVEMVHGGWRPELTEIKGLFTALSSELMMHMQKEEMILFKSIKELAAGYENESRTCFGSIQNPINMMEHEHDTAGDLMKEINRLSDGYTLPKGACATYIVVYNVLNEFENDLFKHIHLENNILFPKAIKLEEN